jgi:hypothetical protein
LIGQAAINQLALLDRPSKTRAGLPSDVPDSWRIFAMSFDIVPQSTL